MSGTNDKHHPLSPSNYNAWFECGCWKSAHKDSVESNAGTSVHKQAQLYIEQDIEPDDKTARWFGDTIKGLANGQKVYCEKKLIGSVGLLKGVYGTADVWWEGEDGSINIADFKTFSDGSTNYHPQLEGYAALYLCDNTPADKKFNFYILHGGIWKVEEWNSYATKCLNNTEKILEAKENAQPTLCKWCQYCVKAKECKEVMNAIDVVNKNDVSFSQLSICQKLVVLDAVDKASKQLREEAKTMCEANGGVLEMDGIRYEMKPWAGPSKVRDLCEVAANVEHPKYLRMDDKKEEAHFIEFNGISHEDLLKLCTLSKTALVGALKEVNKDNKSIKKVEIEKFAGQFFEQTEGKPHFVRTI